MRLRIQQLSTISANTAYAVAPYLP